MATKKQKARSAEQILGASDITYAYVETPEWGGPTRVKSLTGTESDEWEAGLVKIESTKGKRGSGTPTMTPTMKEARVRLAVIAIVDDDGNRLFTDDDKPKLSGKSAAPVRRIFDKVCEMSGISDEVMEELEGN